MKSIYKSADKVLGKVGLSPVSLIGFALLFLVPISGINEFIVRIMVSAVYYGVLGMAFDLSLGYMSVANWGFAGLAGLGGYVSALWVIHLGTSPFLGMLIAGLVTAGLGALICLITSKMDSLFTAIVAWFVGLMLMSLITALPEITRGTSGLNVPMLFSTPWSKPYFWTIWAIALLVFMFFKKLVNSKPGLAFRAIGQDREAALTSGVEPGKFRMLNFTITCFVVGICGAFNAHFISILTPAELNTNNLMMVLVVTYLGGRGSIWGPFLAALIILPVFELMNSLLELKMVLYGLALMLVMIFYPGGLAQALISLKNRISKS